MVAVRVREDAVNSPCNGTQSLDRVLLDGYPAGEVFAAVEE